MLFNYIIYHKNCYDGFTGFFLFMKTNKWEKNPYVYPDVPSTTSIPPEINGKNVIIIDVAYKANILAEIASKASSILFIDHHITISEEIANLKLDAPNKIVYDVNESGASLVWKYFYKKAKMPLFVKYIRDNDIGLWKMDNVFDFMAYLEVNFETKPNFTTLKKWDLLLDDNNVKKYIEIGKYYNVYKNYLIESQAPKHTIKLFPSKQFVKKTNKSLNKAGKYKIAVISTTCPSTSLVGKYIVDNYDCDFCLLWNYNMKSKNYFISLRSKSTDVGLIAKELGGGGHTLASGFSLDGTKYFIEDLFH